MKSDNLNNTYDQNRRQLMKTAAGVAAVGSASALGALLPATNALAQATQGYEEISNPINTKDESKVEVLEFFWLGCPHCYALEPLINKWAADKPDYIAFVREAPPLNPSWEQHSRIFYAAEALGITHDILDAVFERIHKEKKPMRSQKLIAKYVESLGTKVNADLFIKTMNSFTVETAMKRSLHNAQQAGINGVPSIVINGKYRTGGSLAGSHERMIDIINTLSENEHKAS